MFYIVFDFSFVISLFSSSNALQHVSVLAMPIANIMHTFKSFRVWDNLYPVSADYSKVLLWPVALLNIFGIN